jgi:hypothetical protein
VGVDLSPRMVGQARRKSPHLEFIEADAVFFDTPERFDCPPPPGTPAALFCGGGLLHQARRRGRHDRAVGHPSPKSDPPKGT